MKSKDQETFFPTFIFKEAQVALAVFIVIVLLAVFLPAGLGDPSDPSDSAFIPKPEWYFLPLYQFLKIFPGKLEILGIMIQPLMVVGLCLIPFIDSNPERRASKRKFQMTVLGIIIVGSLIFGILGHLS